MRSFWQGIKLFLKLTGMVFFGWILFIWGGFKMIRFFIQLPKGFSKSMQCPAGHLNSTVGKWKCQSCGAEFLGWAWQNCPVCKGIALYIPCQNPLCNLAIRNPFI